MHGLAQLLGTSPPLAEVREQVARLLRPHGPGVRRLPPLLILGETGTGKGLLAGAIHRAGPRAGGPFVDVNCAAIPETLLEAELFGFERGAFTDARQAKAGLFQAAQGGTIFLDEVGLLPLALQAKLLKVVEERTVRRLGSTRSEPLDVAVVAATSEDLASAVAARRFREDLYHRLAVVTLRLPALRERGDDVLLLAEHFLARACADYGLPARALGSDARAALMGHRWPGNVRELGNVMERAALLAEGPVVTAAHLELGGGAAARAAGGPPAGPELADALHEVERTHLVDALRATDWNISRAATRLGIPRNTLRYRMERHGLGIETPDTPRRRRGGRPPTVSRSAAAAGAPPRREARRVAMMHTSLVAARPLPSSETVRALETVVDKIRASGGHVEEIGADRVVAVFGLEPAEDSPLRAVHAALAVQAVAARARREAAERPDVRTAIGVASVQVTVAGDVTALDPASAAKARDGLAATLATAQPGDVVVDPGAAAAARRRFALVPLEVVKGVGLLHRVAGRADERKGRFVGRERELRLLHERFEQARGGQGQVVLLVGEPGIGKSRLLLELRRRLGAEAAWNEGQAQSYGRSMPFHALVDMARRTFRIDDADPEPVVIDKLERRVRRLGDDVLTALPFLRALLGVDPGDPTVSGMDPKLRHAEIRAATRRLIARGAERRPHVLVFEDLHWTDPATEDLISVLADGLAASRVLLVLTFRPGYTPPFGDHTFHTRLAVTALSDDESLGMAEALLEADGLPEPLRRLIAGKAEGNPFFVEELVRALQEGGALRREDGRLALARPLDEIQVPDTVQDVIVSRIARLPDVPRRVLQHAAVLGREFGRRLLERVLPAGIGLDEALRELRAVELVHEKTLFPEPTHAFNHALTHEVAYGSLSAAERRALHDAIARAIEAVHADRLPEHYGLLAYHFSRAEEWSPALAYLLRAGERAAHAFAVSEALDLYDQALGAARRQPGGADAATLVTIHLAKAALQVVRSDFQRSRAEAEQALALARGAGDREREAAALAAVAWAATWARDLEGAVAQAQRAIEVGEPTGATSALARSHVTIGFVSAVTGRIDVAREHLERALTVSEAARDAFHRSLALATAGLVLNWEEDWASAARLQASGLAVAREHGQLYPLLLGGFFYGLTLGGRGDYDAALAVFREGLALSEKVGDEAIHHRLLNCLGWLHLELGDVEGGTELNRRSAAVGRRRLDPGTIPNAEINLGDAALVRGDLALAGELYESVERFARSPDSSDWMRFRWSIRLAASRGELALARHDLDGAAAGAMRCLELATRWRSRKNQVKGWRLAGEVACARRRWDEAEEALRQARDLAVEIGNPPQLWLTQAAIARLEAARGRGEAARAAAQAARAAVAGVAATLADPVLRASLARAPVLARLGDLERSLGPA